jgi:hypothetical protein
MATKSKPYASVKDVLAQIISNWPTLYRTRLQALDAIFGKTYGVDWSNGSPIGIDALDSRDEGLDKPIDETISGSDKHSPNAKLLNVRLDRQKALFVRENAEIIACAEYGEHHDFRSAPTCFSESDLNRMPLEKLSEEWRDAFLEYLRAIIAYSEDKLRLRKALQGIGDRYIEDEVVRLNSSKRAAREAMFRLGQGGKEAEAVRRQVLDKLRYEAERLGFTLTAMKPEMHRL